MKEKFAKLFESPEHGQVLVVRDGGEDGAPELRISCQPGGMGVCTARIGFADSDAGWSLLDKAFDAMDEVAALKIAAEIIEGGKAFVAKEDLEG